MKKECKLCKKEFETKSYNHLFCSNECRDKHRLNFVDDCYLYEYENSDIINGEHCKFYNGKGKYKFHYRDYWNKEKGNVPEGLLIRHMCDDPRCCNINHLELGTTQDNTNDNINRKRNLNMLEVRQNASNILNDSETDYRKLSEKYDTPFNTVRDIKERRLLK